MTFTVGDIHGRSDLLDAALDWIDLQARSHPFINVVFLGDYIDRGPDSRGVIERLMQGLARPSDKLVCLMGNHEEMFLNALKGREDHIERWLRNGGQQTLDSYGGHIPRSHIEWISALPLSFQDEHRFFVHAGINPKRRLHEQNPYDLLWIRDRFLKAEVMFEKHVVHGHTPSTEGPELLLNRTNLDMGAVWTDRLAIAVFHSEIAGGPVHIETVYRLPL